MAEKKNCSLDSILSANEIECLRGYAHGKKIDEIAKKMRCSEFSVVFYTKSAKTKLGKKTTASAVAQTIREKLFIAT